MWTRGNQHSKAGLAWATLSLVAKPDSERGPDSATNLSLLVGGSSIGSVIIVSLSARESPGSEDFVQVVFETRQIFLPRKAAAPSVVGYRLLT